MRIKTVRFLTGGEILAESILTEKNEVLIPKGTELKREYISLIQSLGIESLMIEDPYEHYENPHMIIQSNRLENIIQRVRKIMENHIYHNESKSFFEFEIIANEIVKEIEIMSNCDVIDMKERSSDLYEHTVMVTLLSVMVAKKLGLSKKKQYNIAIGCLLHDIGIRYITVPYENIDLNTLDAASIFEYKKHTILGYSAMENEKWIPNISRKMILSHHENISGTGFPMKQKNCEIECRILQACDAFDCYISGMERKRISVQDALKKMIEDAGILYEKKIVDSLVASIARYPVGTTVRTNKESEAVVLSQTMDPEHPIIMMLDADCESENVCGINLMLEKNISILKVV